MGGATYHQAVSLSELGEKSGDRQRPFGLRLLRLWLHPWIDRTLTQHTVQSHGGNEDITRANGQSFVDWIKPWPCGFLGSCGAWLQVAPEDSEMAMDCSPIRNGSGHWSWSSSDGSPGYPLVMTNIAMENPL